MTKPSDPWDILGLSNNASLEEIRARYLALAKQHPPDREPERFAEIHQAYELVRDPIQIWNSRLREQRQLERLLDERPTRFARIPTDLLLMAAADKGT